MSWFSTLIRGESRRAVRRPSLQSRRPRLETLEDRTTPAFTGLGMAGRFAVLGLANTTVHNYNAMISGDAGVAVGGKFTNWSPSQLMNDIYTVSSGQYSGNGTLLGKVVVDPTSMAQANSDALSASQEAVNLVPTQTFGNIAQPTVVTGNGGLNVINVNGDVRNSLTFSGTANDIFVVNISGNVMLTGSSALSVTGGATADHVLYNVVGSGGAVTMTKGNLIEGTLLVPSRAIHIDGEVEGEVIGGGGTIKLTATEIHGIHFAMPVAHVVSTVVNDGAVQRSRVTDITLSFNQTVSFASTAQAAFTLVRNSDQAAVGFTATVTTVNGQTVVTLSNFTGSAAQFGSLADGRFTLTALSNQITSSGVALDGDGDGQAGGNYTFGDAQGLFRYFGDVNGDRQVDIADFGLFSTTYGLNSGQAGFLASFDVNNDGVIDIADFGQMAIRMFTTLP